MLCCIPHFLFFKWMFMIILSFGWFPSFLILHYFSKIKNIWQFLSLWSILEYPKIVPGLLWWLSGKESACKCRRHGFNPWVKEIPWRREWQPSPVFLPGQNTPKSKITIQNACQPEINFITISDKMDIGLQRLNL